MRAGGQLSVCERCGSAGFPRGLGWLELSLEEDPAGWDAACAAIEAGHAGPVDEDFDLLVLG
ncbi:MAG: hypothetical protein HOU01_05005 [Streptomycetaceae bacterium]|nr:hypothetical protein [Streptomycetaceae bacterium]